MCSGEGYRGEVGREDSGMVFRGNACVSKEKETGERVFPKGHT